MGASDGFISGTTKVVDHGPDALRYNIVLLGDGYRAAEMSKYHGDVQTFIDTLRVTAPFGDIWCGINVHRVDVVSTDSGADDPGTCGDGSAGSGATARTYFDSTFCGGGSIRRLLTCDSASAFNVARTQVPQVHVALLVVNSPIYGGSGGQVATFSTASGAAEIALHEMGHSAFGFADEYEYYAGCVSGEAGHDVYTGGEPVEPNVTRSAQRSTLKWNAELSSQTDPLPTTANPNCAQCDFQPNPKVADYVGAYEGARYMHCGVYRPAYSCRMRALGNPFCGVCQRIIRDTIAPYLPVAFQGLWWAAPAGSESGWGLNTAHQRDTIFATWFTYDATGKAWWLSMTAQLAAYNSYTGTLYETKGPPFNAVPFSPAQVVASAVGTGTLTFTDPDNGQFAYTVNGVSQIKAITKQVFGTLPTCRFGKQSNLALATNYQDLWWNAPPGSESGWGINLSHQDDTIFATWFTYDGTGAPLWLTVTAPRTGATTYAGTLYRTTGPAFNAVPFDPSGVTATAVGSAMFAFADGNNATFSYTLNGVSQVKQITRQVFHQPGTVCG